MSFSSRKAACRRWRKLTKPAPDTPVFLLHLYDSAILNRAALHAIGFDKNTPNPPGGLIARDAKGNPTGLLIAEPSALILYSTIANAPKLSFEDQLNSTRHYMRELNRFGVTSVSDAGGGGQSYPEDYAVVKKLDDEGHLTVRIAYSLFAQKPGQELVDYTRWIGMTKPGEGSDSLRVNGAGENLVWRQRILKTSSSLGLTCSPSWKMSLSPSSTSWQPHSGPGGFMPRTTSRSADFSTSSSAFIRTPRSINCGGSLTTPKRFPNVTWNAFRHSVVGLPLSIAWRTKASIISAVTALNLPSVDRRSSEC